jgi:hypothetical protein
MNEFPKRIWAEVKAEEKAERDAMSAEEIHEQAKARRREQAKAKREAKPPSKRQQRAYDAKQLAERELDDAVWDAASN